MILYFRIILNLCLLASLAQAAAVFQRQGVLTHPVSMISVTQSTTRTLPSPTRTVTEIVIVTSTASPLPPSPIVSRFIATYTRSGQVILSTATVTLLPVVPTSTSRRVSTPFAPSVTQTAEGQSGSSNKGAIAGGVLGGLAVVVAAFAAFVWFRRRSPKHWRNRTAGRWQTLDNKDAGGGGARSIYVGEPVYWTHGDTKQSDPNPLPPLYIRDRQQVVDPFVDTPASPTSPRPHVRSSSTSSATYQRGDGSGRFDIELQPAAGSPK